MITIYKMKLQHFTPKYIAEIKLNHLKNRKKTWGVVKDAVLVVGILSKRYLGDSFLVILKK